MVARGLILTGVLLLAVAPGVASAERVAVLEFSGDGSVEESGLVFLADEVRNAAVRYLDHDQWAVMSRENMLELLEINTEDLSECVGECEVETGRLIGAHLLITGNVVRPGSKYRLTLKAFDTNTGTQVAGESTSAVDVDGLIDALAAVCPLLFGVNVPTGSGSSVPVASATEPSPTLRFVVQDDSRAGEVIDDVGYAMVAIESESFVIGATEVTQILWERVMGTSPSRFKGADLPVEQVSWYESVAFCNRLSEMEGLLPAYTIADTDVSWDQGAHGYRLPTDLEWITAARAGEEHTYSGSDKIREVGWFNGNSANKTHPAAEKTPNAWGLYDMSGNVEEFVWDLFGIASNMQGTTAEMFRAARATRGGAYWSSPALSRLSWRGLALPHAKSKHIGLRLVRTLP